MRAKKVKLTEKQVQSLGDLDIDQFKKSKERLQVTSLNITQAHKDFLKEYDIELGSLVRNYLDTLMRKVRGGK